MSTYILLHEEDGTYLAKYKDPMFAPVFVSNNPFSEKEEREVERKLTEIAMTRCSSNEDLEMALQDLIYDLRTFLIQSKTTKDK